MITRAAAQPSAAHSDRPAVSIEGRDRLTYRDLHDAANRYANAFLDLGAEPGDRVGLLLHNSVEYCIAYFAAVRIGCVAVRLNFRLAAEELRFALTDSGVSILCVSGDLIAPIDALRADVPALSVVHLPGMTPTPSWALSWSVLEAGSSSEPDRPVPSGEMPAMLMYTSGTTGRPKGAIWTHSNSTWIAAAQAIKWNLGPATVALTTGPMYHVGAFEDLFLASLMAGGESIACRSGGFDIGRVLQVLARHQVTDAFLYPFMIYDLLRHPDLARSDLSSLRRIITGGSAIAEWAIRQLAEQLPQTALNAAYGLTEGGAITTVLDYDELRRHPGAVGRPLVGTELRIVGDGGTDLDPGQTGEIWVRSPSVSVGYWNNVQATQETFVDGWCRTGDLGQIGAKSGLLTITGRKKDMIKTGGENVYPAELERLLADHADVADVAVIGVPDEKLQESICAVVVRVDGSGLEAKDIMSYCAQFVARYKIPRHVWFVDSLPRNAAGKVLKQRLREEFRSSSAGGSTRR